MNKRSDFAAPGRKLVAIALQRAAFVLFLGGALAIGYAGYVLVDAQSYQAIALGNFKHRAPISEPHIPLIGEVVGRITIPRLRFEAAIAQGASSEVLRRAVGHVPETPLPGDWGNVALAAHRDRLFRPLRQIRPGDIITVDTPRGSFHYSVESTFVVPPTDLRVLQSSGTSELTLITCFPFEYVGPAPNRFIVRAKELASTAAK